MEQGIKDHTETILEVDTRERNVDTTTVMEDETMIEVGADWWGGGVGGWTFRSRERERR